MRLSKQYVTTIRETVIQRFGPAAKVSLFGSRVNEDARGGDIDLLVELVNVPTHPFRETIGLETGLHEIYSTELELVYKNILER